MSELIEKKYKNKIIEIGEIEEVTSLMQIINQ